MIRREQLESIIALNREIDNEVRLIAEKDLEKYSQEGINIAEAIAFKLGEMCELIQLPLNDNKIGGLIIKRDTNFYCLINTTQPRAFQNFVYLHEFYHLLHANEKFHLISDSVENETSIEERKANYYASLMLLNKEALRMSFYYLAKDRGLDLKTSIYYLMNLFKTTYKTIIIRLYEIGCIEDFSVLYENFSNDIKEIAVNFNRLGLDKSIIEPSHVTSVGNLEKYIKNAAESGTILEDFIDLNRDKYYEIMEKIRKIQEQ